MDSLVPVNFHFSKELQWFRAGHGSFSSRESSFQQGITMVSWWTWILYFQWTFILARNFIGFCEFIIVLSSQTHFRKRAKSASGALGPKSAPGGSKSTTFGKVFFRPFSPLKFFPNPVGEASVPPIQRPIYRWDQAEVWEEFGIGAWCVVSCTSIQISKFTVQP